MVTHSLSLQVWPDRLFSFLLLEIDGLLTNFKINVYTMSFETRTEQWPIRTTETETRRAPTSSKSLSECNYLFGKKTRLKGFFLSRFHCSCLVYLFSLNCLAATQILTAAGLFLWSSTVRPARHLVELSCRKKESCLYGADERRSSHRSADIVLKLSSC